jgi:hypothetical protein
MQGINPDCLRRMALTTTKREKMEYPKTVTAQTQPKLRIQTSLGMHEIPSKD